MTTARLCALTPWTSCSAWAAGSRRGVGVHEPCAHVVLVYNVASVSAQLGARGHQRGAILRCCVTLWPLSGARPGGLRHKALQPERTQQRSAGVLAGGGAQRHLWIFAHLLYDSRHSHHGDKHRL